MSKVKLWATVSGITTFLGWFITLTPEQQSSLFAPIIALIPVAWQSYLGVALKAIGAISGVYSVFKLRNKLGK